MAGGSNTPPAPESRSVVLITGSSGLIGSALARRLLREYTVVGFDRPGGGDAPSGIDAVSVDLTDDRSVQDAVAQVRKDHGERLAAVVHLAAYYDFSGERNPLYDTVTIGGTRRLLTALQTLAVEQVVFSSTILVHAPTTPGHPIDEAWPLLPKWPYPDSKVRAETVLWAEHGEVPMVIMRIAGVYTDRCQSPPLAHQIQRILERQPTASVYPGDLSHGQAFVHLEDLVDAIARSIEHRASLPHETVLLIGEPLALSYAELQVAFGQLIYGEEWQTKEIPKAVAKAGALAQDLAPFVDDFIKPFMVDLADDHYELDVGRARELLGWRPQHELRGALGRMIWALREDPERFYKENKLGDPPAAVLSPRVAR